MREYTPAEVEDKILRRGGGQVGEGGDLLGGEERAGGKGGVERWFTWEHEEGWRQVQYQFLGAIRSHGKFLSWLVEGLEESRIPRDEVLERETILSMLGTDVSCIKRLPDPNQLQALLSVYNWHIDTLLQLSQVYQQQNGTIVVPFHSHLRVTESLRCTSYPTDVGAASDFCFRAIFAYDRALAPGFNLGGMCRVDFDRVENRGLFLALNRNIA